METSLPFNQQRQQKNIILLKWSNQLRDVSIVNVFEFFVGNKWQLKKEKKKSRELGRNKSRRKLMYGTKQICLCLIESKLCLSYFYMNCVHCLCTCCYYCIELLLPWHRHCFCSVTTIDAIFMKIQFHTDEIAESESIFLHLPIYPDDHAKNVPDLFKYMYIFS